MSQVARYAKVTAKPTSGKELAKILLGAADELGANPGCQLYLVNRQADQPDVLWVTELWRSQADLDASLEQVRGSDDATQAMALVDDWQLIELDLLGGKGPSADE
jgi:quinol monooxygenase YgiN